MGWAAAVAMDKRGKLLAARRGADRGLVVVADRYPQNEDVTYSDAPLLQRLGRRGGSTDWKHKPMSSRDACPPDLVIKLEVGAATLARREPDMNADVIQHRIEGFRRLAFTGARTVLVRAEQPLPDVLRAIKREVWRTL